MVKILLTIEDGRIRACANGSVEIYVEDINTLDDIQQIQVTEIPCADLDAFLAGRTTYIAGKEAK